jgi:hypothetical protein
LAIDRVEVAGIVVDLEIGAGLRMFMGVLRLARHHLLGLRLDEVIVLQRELVGLDLLDLTPFGDHVIAVHLLLAGRHVRNAALP